ncbi:BMP family ABC transporter substrate-binding protein [Xylophilus sp. GOD-11R]|uniref:BMP family ABC transporter substrate-binding protein n=1 Tax=Xylophilus sp. GOD-11R TaxID=3089814 RepID=UPI00298CD254|nr:BMP family ABC transporter substrate-binding protein [Xylophilus sp. GOD-11R]WPB55716.1 BMP family ABC transporter substrate-binding protein [Xylophilus sp. GOD-11R]
MQRRQLLASALSGAGALSLTGLPLAAHAAAPAKPLKIGFVYSGPVSDVGWTYQHDLGRKMVEKEFGAQVKTVFVESVPEGPDAERVIRDLAGDGCGMVFTTSFGFMEPTIRVAPDFPEVAFEHCSGYKMARNVGIYQTRFYEGAYLLGTIAGRMTKTNVLGYVAPFPIPEVIRNLDAFVLGARSVNPKVTAKVVWISSWYDPAREREAAQTLANQGADTFYQNTDSPAVVQLAESKGLYAFGQDSDMSRFGAKSHLTGNVLNWGVYYVHKVRQKLAGQWKAEDTKWGMKEGIVQLAPLNPVLPKDVAASVEKNRAAIVAGTLLPFAGPITDQAGKVRVAAGQGLADDELWKMKFYVNGIVGSQP